MKRKQRKQPGPGKPPVSDVEAQGVSLGDLLTKDIARKLGELKKAKEEEIRKQKEEEQARKQFEAKQRERNKSFEELLNESNLDWKKFKG